MLHQMEAPEFYIDLGLQTVLNLSANGKFKDFSRPFSVFQGPFKANLIFKDFSRQSCIFKPVFRIRFPIGHLENADYKCRQ